MATVPRQRNSRSFGIFDTSAERDDDVATVMAVGTATAYSKPILGPMAQGISSIQLQWTAGNTGTFSVWGSLKRSPDLANDNDWVQITPTVIGDALAIAGSAGKCILNITGTLPEWLRIKYVNASGTGSSMKGYARIDGDRH